MLSKEGEVSWGRISLSPSSCLEHSQDVLRGSRQFVPRLGMTDRFSGGSHDAPLSDVHPLVESPPPECEKDSVTGF